MSLFATWDLQKINIPLWTCWTMFGLTYYGLLLLSDRIYNDSDDDTPSCSFDYAPIFYLATAEIIGVCVSSQLIDGNGPIGLGRSKTQSLSYALSGLFVLIVGLTSSKGAVFAMAYIGRICIMSASNATWVITPELYATVSYE